MGKTRDKIIEIYLIVSLLSIAFVEIEASGSVPLRVFHISQNKGYILLLLSLATCALLLFCNGRKLLRFDRIVFALGLKCLLDLMPCVFNDIVGDSIYWYFFSMMLTMPIVYCIFRNYTGNPKTIVNFLTIFGLILISQELITIVNNGFPYDSPEYKHFLRIPAAHSNVIGVILLAILCFRFKLYEKSRFDFIINIVYIIGLLIIQSAGSLLLLIVWFLYLQYTKLQKKSVYLARLLLLVVIVGITIFTIKSGLIQIFFEIKPNRDIALAVLTSGRTDIWTLAWLEFLRSPVLGSGIGVVEYDIGYEVITTGAHNIILDLLVQSGLLGLFLYAYAVFYGIRENVLSDRFNEAIKMGVIVLLSYSLIEVCYFNYSCLYIFWMFIGLYNRK